MGDTKPLVSYFYYYSWYRCLVTDSWKGYLHYFPTSSERCCKNVLDFADCLSYKLLNNNFSNFDLGESSNGRKRRMLSPIQEPAAARGETSVEQIVVCNKDIVSSPSPLTIARTTRTMTPRALWRHFRALHPLEKIDNKYHDGNTKSKIL